MCVLGLDIRTCHQKNIPLTSIIPKINPGEIHYNGMIKNHPVVSSSQGHHAMLIKLVHGNNKDFAPFSRLCLELLMMKKHTDAK